MPCAGAGESERNRPEAGHDPTVSAGAAADHSAAGRALFAAGDFATARTRFALAVAAGDLSPDTVETLRILHADAGDYPAIADLMTTYLDRTGPDLSSAIVVASAAALFDAVAVTEPATERRAEAALRLLEAAAASGETGWEAVQHPVRRSAIVAAFPSPSATLERLEQETYAPPGTGLPAQALARAEEIGHRHATDPALARAAERLLHGAGDAEAAYRVERAPRAARSSAPADRTGDADATKGVPERSGLAIAIAGGHPALRAFLRRALSPDGIRIAGEIPSPWEATRHARQVREQLAGADLAVLIGRQLAHSTADQVRDAARRLGIPVVTASAASAAAVRRALLGYVSRRTV